MVVEKINLDEIIFSWSKEKNELLKKWERKISFEMVIWAIENNQILDIIENPSWNFNNQKFYIIEINDYVYLVPYVENWNEKFLKTIFPSRKHKKFYLNN
jgi:hypothetical protein